MITILKHCCVKRVPLKYTQEKRAILNNFDSFSVLGWSSKVAGFIYYPLYCMFIFWRTWFCEMVMECCWLDNTKNVTKYLNTSNISGSRWLSECDIPSSSYDSM